MPKKHNPRRSSLQFRPRKRARSENVRVRTWPKKISESKLLGFAGYKVGMTHVIVSDTSHLKERKGKPLFLPVTVVECPPMKVLGFRGYINTHYGLRCKAQRWVDNLDKIDKNLSRSLSFPKKSKNASEIPGENLDEVRLLVMTQPGKTGIGKKKPEIFEVGLGGEVAEQLKFAEDNLGKEIRVGDVLKESQQIDTCSVTKGKGFQGPVKRHGVKIRFHKSEKTKRGPGSLGPWHGPRLWKVAHAGQTGYHQRSEYNKLILKIGDDPKLINPKGGFLQYGLVKNDFILLKGSIGGPRKRLVKMVFSIRPNKKLKEAPSINYISLESKQ